MPTSTDTERWFVLNFIRKSQAKASSAQETVARFNRETQRLELFAPTLVSSKTVNGKAQTVERPLTFHYVFVRGLLEDVKALCRADNGFSLLIDQSSGGRYAIVPDEAMAGFRIIARAYENRLPFYSLADIDLMEGDLVEVVEGELAGLRGVFLPRRKSGSGAVVIAATAEFGSMVWEVKVSAVRVIRFAKGTKRPYDQIDAFVPRLLAALRRHHSGNRLGPDEIAPLMVFCRRMTGVRLDNPKLEGKLQALLAASCAILGDTAGEAEALSRLASRRGDVTNPATESLILLLSGALGHDLSLIHI